MKKEVNIKFVHEGEDYMTFRMGKNNPIDVNVTIKEGKALLALIKGINSIITVNDYH